MYKLIFSGLAAVGVAAAAQGATTTIFQDDFESAPEVSSDPPRTGGVEADPVATVGTWVLGHRADYAEQVTDYSPPGPQVGNQYLRLSHVSSSEANAVFAAPQAGDFTADFYVNVEHSGFRIFLKDAAGNIGGWLSWGEGGAGFIAYRSSAPAWVATTAEYVIDVWQHVVLTYHYSPTTPTMDISIDGSTATALPFYDDNINEIDRVFFAGGDATGLSEYVDDVLVTIEEEFVEFTEIDVSDVTGLQFLGSAGAQYRLQYSIEPLTNVWVTTDIIILGTGNTNTVFDPTGYSTQKVYRIVNN